MECKNCGTSFEGNYCPHCGQKSHVSRLNMLYLRDEIANNILRLNRGFLFSIKALTINPGHTIRGFIEGKRVNHIRPVSFLLISATLYVIANHLLGQSTFIDDFASGWRDGGFNDPDSAEFKFFSWVINYQVYVVLIAMLFFSLASYLAFLRSGYNLIEHLVLNFFITGYQFLIYAIFSFIIQDQDDFIVVIPLVLGFFYNIWVYYQFFNNYSIFKKTALLVLTYILLVLEFFIVLISTAIIRNAMLSQSQAML